jgi:hypothetical protein
MCVQVTDAISKSKSPEFSAKVVVPLLVPLLTAHSLPPQLFQDYMASIRGNLQRIEQWRAHGVAGKDAGLSSPHAATDHGSWDDTPSTVSTAGPHAQGGGEIVPALGLGGAGSGAVNDWAAMLAGPTAPAVPSASSSQASLQSLGSAGVATAVGRARATSGLRANGVLAAPPDNATAVPSSGWRAQGGAVSSLNVMTPARGGAGVVNGGSAPGLSAVGQLSVMQIDAASFSSAPRQAGAQPAVAGGSVRAGGQSFDPFAGLCIAQPAPKSHAQIPQKVAGGNVAAPTPAPACALAAAPDGDWDDDWDPFT